MTAAFAFSGTELIGLAAAESKTPLKTLPSACKQVFWRVTLFYILSLLFVGFLIRSDDPEGGLLTLEGVILNEARAARFVELVKGRVLGLSGVESKIRTATVLLNEIERLADTAQIRSFVLLRIADDLIEATGAIPAEKVDAFVGFLQSYARRFARDTPVRSAAVAPGEDVRGRTAAECEALPEALASLLLVLLVMRGWRGGGHEYG